MSTWYVLTILTALVELKAFRDDGKIEARSSSDCVSVPANAVVPGDLDGRGPQRH